MTPEKAVPYAICTDRRRERWRSTLLALPFSEGLAQLPPWSLGSMKPLHPHLLLSLLAHMSNFSSFTQRLYQSNLPLAHLDMGPPGGSRIPFPKALA